MSDDGADLGLSAEQGLKAVLGGEEPAQVETVEQMRERILTAPLDAQSSYDGCATACARIILEALERWPVLTSVPTETIYLRDGSDNMVLVGESGEIVSDYSGGSSPIPLSVSLYEVLKRLHPEGTPQHAVFMELTGFMWGWALNAARRCAQIHGVEMGPVQNPAIIEVR